MNTQHTPGPWGIGSKVKSCVYGADGSPICEANSIGEQSRATDFANARLIAAAPELLAALQAMCVAQELGCLSSEAYKAARAAIEKATQS